MPRARKPVELRQKGDKDFLRFMRSAVYEPLARGVFANDPTVRTKETFEERMARGCSIDELTDSDLLALLRHLMLRDGVAPLSPADNIHARLVERARRRETGHSLGARKSQ